MEMEETFFACSTQELSCIIGNLFVEIDAPCDIKFGEEKGLVICGTTHSGKHGLKKQCCRIFAAEKAKTRSSAGVTGFR